MNRLTSIILLAGAISLSALGLSDTAFANAPAKPQNQEEAASSITKIPELSEEQLQGWVKKLNTYTSLFNSTSRGMDSWKRYQSWVNIKNGVTGKERHIYGLYSLHEYTMQRNVPQALEAVKGEPRIERLDQLAADYIASYEKLFPVVKEAYNYYNRKDYSDDKFAKGKEMHPALVAAFQDYEGKRSLFDTELTTIKEQVDLQFLDHIEKSEGKNYRWHSKRTLMAALKAVEALQAVNGQKDAHAFSEAIRKYAAIVHEFDDFIAANPDAEKLGSDLGTKPGRILAELRDARDALEKGKIDAFNRAAQDVISQYNNMVR